MSKVKVINRITGKEHTITANELEAWQNAGIPVKVVDYPKPDILKENKPKEVKE
jgi:hypothetical protein